MSRLLVSFSGGETSALMTKLIIDNWQDKYDDILVVFANTGCENEQTLEFVDACDRYFGWAVVWVEGYTGPRGIGARAKEVTFETASRDGKPMEEVIAKFGIPNQKKPLCSKETKARPITAYCRDTIGWKTGSYDTAIGIRLDEIDRMSPQALDRRLVYPLVSTWPHRKVNVNAFWRDMPFRLNLKGYEGNCVWCWKKTLRKHLTLIREQPSAYDFPERMEREHGLSGNNPEGTPRRFFRGAKTVDDLRQLAATEVVSYHDDARVYPDTEAELDISGGCSESCEVDFDDV